MRYPRNSTLLIVFLFVGPLSVKSQFLWAEVGVDGLTCSACSRAVEMSIVKLNFVDSVVMNLENTEGKIFFKKTAKVDFDKIAKAVIDAGFSVRFLRADFVFTNVSVTETRQFVYENVIYQFIKTPEKTLNGETTITFIGNKFLSKKEFSHWKEEIKNNSTDKKEKIYFITL